MTAVIPYEQRLNADRRWALMEGSMHFENESSVFTSMLRIVKRLEELQVPYALIGAMAMFMHGYRRFTENVDILVSKEGAETCRESLIGSGYCSDAGAHLRDAETGVRIKLFLHAAFETQLIDGIRCLTLSKLVGLKLERGQFPGRLRDLGDVQELILTLRLPESFAERLTPSVRESYLELRRPLLPHLQD